MYPSIHDALIHFLSSKGHPDGAGQRRAAVDEAIAAAIDHTDPRIRLVSGHRKRLRGVVASALDYVDALVERIPGLLEISRIGFATDPRVRAFFVNPDDLRAAISRSSELREYLGDARCDACCALLCMKKTERRILGMEMQGDMLRRDVAQVSISFSDHHIDSPAPSEAEAREGLKHCLCESLLNRCLERINRQKLGRRRLEAEIADLRRRRAKPLAPAGREGEAPAVAEVRLAELEAQLESMPEAGPAASLAVLEEVLGGATEHVRIHCVSLEIDDMGIVVESGSTRRGHRVEVAEAELGNGGRRVVVLARIPREELLPQRELMARAERLLAI